MVHLRQPGAMDFRCLVRVLYKKDDRYGGYFTVPG